MANLTMSSIMANLTMSSIMETTPTILGKELDVHMMTDTMNVTNIIGLGKEFNISRELMDSVDNGTEVRTQFQVILDHMATGIMTANTVNLMLGMGAATYWRDVVKNLWPPIGILIGMGGQFMVLPLLGFCLSLAFQLRPYEAMGVLMVSCSPGGSFSNFLTYWMDGDLALSIVMTTCSSVVAFGGMPLNLWIYSQYWMSKETELQLPFTNIVASLFLISVPLVVGMVVRHCNEIAATKVTKVSSILGFVGIAIVAVVWLIRYWNVFVRATQLIYAAAIIMPFIGFTLAYILARICCRSHKICRTIGIETGSQNMPVALSVILLSFKEGKIKEEMIVFPTLYGVLLLVEMFIAIGFFQLYKKKCVKEKEEYPIEHKASIEKGTSAEKAQLNI